jgi:hypothetical protein
MPTRRSVYDERWTSFDPRDVTYARVVEKRNRLAYATFQLVFDVAKERPRNLIGRESRDHAGILRTADGFREKEIHRT